MFNKALLLQMGFRQKKCYGRKKNKITIMEEVNFILSHVLGQKRGENTGQKDQA